MVKFREVFEEFAMAFLREKVADQECMCAYIGLQ
jgi:hypothetical protein